MIISEPKCYVSQIPATDTVQTSPSASSAPVRDVLRRLNDRSKDYILRMQQHGSPLQKQMVTSVYNALVADTMIHNNGCQPPVYQYGKAATIDGQTGVLMANFIAHDEKLELAALGFRAQRYFEHDHGPVTAVYLEDAKALPRAGSSADFDIAVAARLAPNNTKSAHLDLRPLAPVPEMNEADKQAAFTQVREMVIEHQKTSMRTHMAKALAERRIKEGQSLGKQISPASALAGAHLELMNAQIKKWISGRPTPAAHSPLPPAEKRKAPQGLQYEFPNKAFALFHEDVLAHVPTATSDATSGAPIPSALPEPINNRRQHRMAIIMNGALIRRGYDFSDADTTNKKISQLRDSASSLASMTASLKWMTSDKFEAFMSGTPGSVDRGFTDDAQDEIPKPNPSRR